MDVKLGTESRQTQIRIWSETELYFRKLALEIIDQSKTKASFQQNLLESLQVEKLKLKSAVQPGGMERTSSPEENVSSQTVDIPATTGEEYTTPRDEGKTVKKTGKSIKELFKDMELKQIEKE